MQENHSIDNPARVLPLRRQFLPRAADSACIRRMQKALTEMNLQLANVISDISGATGMRPV